MIRFKRKEFSIGSSAKTGALLGASVGSILGGSAPIKFPRTSFLNKSDRFNEYANKYDSLSNTDTRVNKDTGKKSTHSTVSINQRLALLGVSTLVGALLGTLVGVGKELNNKTSRLTSVDDRLMRPVIKELKSKSYKEGIDFTRDPKEANAMKTKVCIVISKNAGEFKVLVNVVDDPKLKYKSEKIIKSLSGKYQVRYNSVANRYNEVNISTISDASSNKKTTVDIISGFIDSGYPVYIVEVG